MDPLFHGVDPADSEIESQHRSKKTQRTQPEMRTLNRQRVHAPVIRPLKADHRAERCHLMGALGDRVHAVRYAAGYDTQSLLRVIS